MGIPVLLRKYGDKLKFTAYGNPFFTYRYKKTGMIEKDAQLLLQFTEELLLEMKKILHVIQDEAGVRSANHNTKEEFDS